jgi:Tfp pilus assembly protein PilW
MLASVAIITLLMGAVFSFMISVQKRTQGSLVISESNQTARAAMELMTQEIGQAGFNPQFTNSVTDATAITPSATPACVTLNNITGIYPGDFLVVDVGAFMETVEVVATSNGKLSGQTVCGAANQIKAAFKSCHGTAVAPCGPTGSTLPIPFMSYKFPYPTGILRGQSVTWGSSTINISNDHILAFFGDIENNQTPQYVVYSLYNPTPSVAAPSVTINGQTYYLYNLYRSETNLNYNAGTANNNASPLVQNVIYQDITSVNPVGPTGQPIFVYPNNVNIAITPSVVTVVGTVVINLCVAVNPKSLETGTTVQWYTMATQIRPMNLWAAVTITLTGGSKYLVQDPLGLPMTFPALTTYY